MTTDWFQYPYNYSNGSEVNGLGDFIKYNSLQVGNYLGMGIVIAIWLFIFGLSMASGSRKALLTSSFITFLFSLYLVRLEILNPIFSIVLIVLTIIGLLGGKSENQSL